MTDQPERRSATQALAALREAVLPEAALAPEPLVPGIWLDLDPEAQVSGRWSSPRGRMLELTTTVTTPGRWLALHIDLAEIDVRMAAYVGLAVRSAAAPAMASRVCLRSGLPEGQAGFHDQFLPRHILSQPAADLHHDLIAPAQCPDMPDEAPWRQLILFLPPGRSISFVLHDLRLIVL